MKTTYESGDIFKNNITGDKVIILANVPKAVKLPNESPTLHPDDFIDVTNEKWIFIENNEDKLVKAIKEAMKIF